MSNFFDAFLALISMFLSGNVDPAVFKAEYMRLWRECRDAGQLDALNATANQAFDRIFTAADAYCEDPTLRDSSDLDDRQFVDEVGVIAKDLHG